MPINIIATAHGSESLEGRDTTESMIKCLQNKFMERLGPLVNLYEAYVDVQIPELEEVLSGLPASDQAVILPLHLSTDHYLLADMQLAVENSDIENISIADSLGPSAHLAQLMHHRLIEKGWRLGDAVVMVADNALEDEKHDDVARQCELLSDELGQEVSFGFVGTQKPPISKMIEKASHQGGNVFIANYLLGRGFADNKVKILAEDWGATATDPLMIPGDEDACDTMIACALDNLDAVEQVSEVL